MKYSIVYSSKTGNTKKLADTIKDTLDDSDCIYFGSPDSKALSADKIYIGFWTDKGTCDSETLDFIKTLNNQEVFLFGTAGFGGNKEYYEKIINSIKKNISSGVIVKGYYMCQGKMPVSVRQRYEKMQAMPDCPVPNIQQMIKNFDKALNHPDSVDIENLKSALK